MNHKPLCYFDIIRFDGHLHMNQKIKPIEATKYQDQITLEIISKEVMQEKINSIIEPICNCWCHILK